MSGARQSIGGIIVLAVTTAASTTWAQSAPPPPPPPAQGAAASAPNPPPPPPPPPAGARESGVAAAPLTPIPAPTPAEVRYRRMKVDVETTREAAVLERRVQEKESNGAWLIFPWHGEEAAWEQVCVAPCRGADLDRYSTYRVAEANHISKSRPFTLPQGGDTVHLRIDAGSQTAHRIGRSMAAIGGAALIVGTVLIGVAPTLTNHDHERDYRTGGWITAGTGFALLAIGIPLAILTQTGVYADNERRVADAPPKGRFIGNGFTF